MFEIIFPDKIKEINTKLEQINDKFRKILAKQVDLEITARILTKRINEIEKQTNNKKTKKGTKNAK